MIASFIGHIRISSVSFLVLLMVCGVCVAATMQAERGEEVLNIPADLYHYAKGQGCSQVASFYKERPEVREPPYVYGLFSGPESVSKDFSAAFWCEQPDRGARKYVLLLKLDGKHWPGGCAARIENQDFAGGLSVIRDADEPLELYWNMKDKKSAGKAGEKTAGPSIQSFYDGTGNIYYCHHGEWVSRPLDE